MRRYETVVILMAELKDEEKESMQRRWEDLIQQFKGELIKTEDWGQKKLAYDIKKESIGHYFLLDYGIEDISLIKELERVLRLEDNVLKYMTVKVSEKIDIKAIREQERLKKEAMEKDGPLVEAPSETEIEEESLPEKGEIE